MGARLDGSPGDIVAVEGHLLLALIVQLVPFHFLLEDDLVLLLQLLHLQKLFFGLDVPALHQRLDVLDPLVEDLLYECLGAHLRLKQLLI